MGTLLDMVSIDGQYDLVILQIDTEMSCFHTLLLLVARPSAQPLSSFSWPSRRPRNWAASTGLDQRSLVVR